MIKTVIFDFDGTIVDSGKLMCNLFNEFADKYHYKEVSEQDFDLIRSMPVKLRFQKLHVPLVKVPFLARDVVRKYTESIPGLKASEGIKRVLSDLRESGNRLIARHPEDIVKIITGMSA